MTERHHFDPGPTGIETHCHAAVTNADGKFPRACGHALRSPLNVHFQPEEDCVGCLTGYDIGLPHSGVAYAHPECPVHSEVIPMTPEECAYNAGVSCAEIMRCGNGHCCEEYQTRSK